MQISNDLQEVRLPIEGMECAACAVRLERQLSKSEGVSVASVNFATNEASVAFDPSRASLDDLASIVRKTGFSIAEVDEKTVDARAGYSTEWRRFLFAAVLTVPIFLLSMFPNVLGIPDMPWILLLLSTPVVVIAGAPFFIDAFNVLRSGSANMNSLISLGVGAAYSYSVVATLSPELVTSGVGTAHVYYEAAAVITTLVLLGRLFEAKAKARTTAAIRSLLNLQPDTAILIRDDGDLEVPVSEVSAGDRIRLKPGSRVPVDGVIIQGETDIDESMLTGEPMPIVKRVDSKVSAGTINLTGSAVFRAEKVGKDTALHRIIELVRSAQGQKPPIQRLADRVSAVFVPSILVAAIVTTVIWTIFGPEPPLRFALLTGVSVLIIACPCALGLATPTAILVGLGRAASSGIFMKGGDALERLSRIDCVVIDKTGTITEGKPEVTAVDPASMDERSLLQLAASLESHSEHPIAGAICRLAGERELQTSEAGEFRAHVGGGVTGRLNGSMVAIGSADFVVENSHNGISRSDLEHDGRIVPGETVVYVVNGGRLAGSIRLADRIRASSSEGIQRLHALGVRVVMASGDRTETAKHVADQLGIDEAHGGLRPEGKVDLVRKLQTEGRRVALVGDGINDAPGLAAADVGIAVRAGTDIALETADVGLMKDDLRAVAEAIETSRKTMRTIRQNLFFAFAYNVTGIPIAAGVLYPLIGLLLNPMIAAGAMAASSLSVVTNSLRLRSA